MLFTSVGEVGTAELLKMIHIITHIKRLSWVTFIHF